MKLTNFASLVVTCLLVTTVAADAGGDSTARAPRPPIPDPDAIIAACKAKYHEGFASGVTTKMRAAAIDAAFCVRDAIVDNMVILSNEKQRPNIIKYLDAINDGVGGFYWLLYNDIDACHAESNMGCGTMWQPMHNAKVGAVYEQMLKDTIEQRKRLHW